MIERDKILHGTRLRLLRPKDVVAQGTLGRVDTVREENWGAAWGFSVYWDDYRKKNRYSLYFTEADLENFELAGASQSPVYAGKVARRHARVSSVQLVLPFTEVALYRGTDIVGSFEMVID